MEVQILSPAPFLFLPRQAASRRNSPICEFARPPTLEEIPVNSVFLLWYVCAPGTDNEDELIIGVYAAEEAARAAIKRLSSKPGFCAALDGFQVSEYKLNEYHWTEGFVVA